MSQRRPVSLNIRMSEPERESLREAARLRNVSIAEMIRTALERDGVKIVKPA
jgi:uncharacterized protein (DUF1778 family)